MASSGPGLTGLLGSHSVDELLLLSSFIRLKLMESLAARVTAWGEEGKVNKSGL